MPPWNPEPPLDVVPKRERGIRQKVVSFAQAHPDTKARTCREFHPILVLYMASDLVSIVMDYYLEPNVLPVHFNFESHVYFPEGRNDKLYSFRSAWQGIPQQILITAKGLVYGEQELSRSDWGREYLLKCLQSGSDVVAVKNLNSSRHVPYDSKDLLLV